ncbi:MAG: thiamine-monophosphate kinase [Planctomycetota bacterium]|nr:MAG: thiamine-monophosphate kinase [Planctomycetota bacterium]
MSSGEQRFLHALFPRGTPSTLPIGPGDDAAQLPGGQLAALDTVVEGVHFKSAAPRADVAYKALAACASDFAAMGAHARWALLSAQIPPGEDLVALAQALREGCARLGLELVGGDTVAAPRGALALAVTLLGPAPAGPVWTRSGGQPGDRLFVSGALGGSSSGRHLRPQPRGDLVDSLRAEAFEVHAAMDLSDGLGVDLARLCAASGCGAVVRAEQLPVHADVSSERDGPLAALSDGEDFELLLALPASARPPVSLGLIEIGTLQAAPELLLERHGRREAWPVSGFEHEL